MSIDMYVSASQRQAASTKRMIQQQLEGYQQMERAIGQFVFNSQTLTGAAYDSAKQHYSSVLLPLIKGGKLYSEAVARCVAKLPSDYQAKVDSGDLKESELEKKIAELDAKIREKREQQAHLRSLSLHLPSEERGRYNRSQKSLSNSIETLEKSKKKLKEKLQKLREFNISSVNIFAGLAGLQRNIAMGSKLATSQWNGSVFVRPSKEQMTWADEINKQWEKSTTKFVIDEQEQKKLLKEFNDLYSKNPAAALDKVKNDKRLFNYLVTALDKCPEGFQNALLDIFILGERWNELPKNYAETIFNHPKFALYIESLSGHRQEKVINSLIKLNDKGWDIMAPVGYLGTVLSKSSTGGKLIAASKLGYKQFQKLKPMVDFLKQNKWATEALSYGGDTFTVASYAYEEYINPNSPAYGDMSKAIYGGQNIFFSKVGPLEGAQYGYVPGAIGGSLNYFLQGGGISDIPLLNKIPIIKNADNWHKWVTQEDVDKWLAAQYEFYDRRKENLESGNIEKIKEDWFGEQKGRVGVEDFNNGLPKW